MRKFLALILLVLSFSPTYALDTENLKFTIEKTTLKQGEFFQAYLKGYNKKIFGAKPRIWFNTKEYNFFEIPDPYEWTVADPKKRKKRETVYRALIPIENLTKPGSYSVLAKIDNWSQKVPVKVIDNKKPISKITLSGDKSGLSASQKELAEVGAGLRVINEEKIWEGRFILPSKATKSSPFGVKRSYNGAPVSSYHKGLDFAAAKGSPVYAPSDAKVAEVGLEAEGYNVHGNTIILDHGHRVTSIYMHLSKIEVTKGQMVKQGDKIGEVGHTGISTGPHLHWGVYIAGTSVEPENFVNTEIK